MEAVWSFTIIMLVWTFSEYVSRKTHSLLSTLLVASLVFLIGFQTKIFRENILPVSSLLGLGGVVVGFIIVHIGTLISVEELKRQWKTVVIGISTVLGTALALYFIGGLITNQTNFIIAGIAAVTGGTISIVMVQEAAANINNNVLMAFPVLIAAFQGLIGFPLTTLMLRKEATRLKALFRKGELEVADEEDAVEKKRLLKPISGVLRTTQGTLFCVGIVVVISMLISDWTNGALNTFIVALFFGVALREIGLFPPSVLNGIDAFGLMMLSILILVFGPLATVNINDIIALGKPLIATFVIGIGGSVVLGMIVGKVLGYSIPMSIAIGLTGLFGFPGTMILSNEAANSIAENEEEKKAILGEILPKMIIAGFSTVTITSVIITGILVGFIR